ncbi:MAG: peroxiredoxin [Sandarakinorhabdus sp.]|nr:peroxiredoxin [Sandarakinorhabdus sp.]
MKPFFAIAAAIIAASTAPAMAALAVGAPAPDFRAKGSLGGEPFKFHLAEALKKGPVVLYFFPAAFTSGCTIEAHNFAEAADDFAKMGATLIGVTAGNVERIAEFSKSECRSKFPVAGDPKLDIAKRYDATLALFPGHSDRTSYVIGSDGKISAVYSNLSAQHHVEEMLAGVTKWRAAHPR